MQKQKVNSHNHAQRKHQTRETPTQIHHDSTIPDISIHKSPTSNNKPTDLSSKHPTINNNESLKARNKHQLNDMQQKPT